VTNSSVQPAPPAVPAAMQMLLANTVVAYLPSSMVIQIAFNGDGTVFYSEVPIKEKELAEAHTGRGTWELTGNDVCIITPDKDRHCLPLPNFSQGIVVRSEVRTTNADGTKDLTPTSLVFLRGRP
ncbi:MAG: hypothetical protein ACREXP_19840, partial [Steroidobacteraceae bacterium]